jgi:UPF0716 protein FxsA
MRGAGIFVLGFIALEIFLLVTVGRWIGGGATFLALVAGAIAGGWMIRRQARRALAAMQSAAIEGAPPTGAAASAMGVLVGVLLLIPGFASDALALLLLVPWVRNALQGRVQLAFARRAPAMGLGGLGGLGGFGMSRGVEAEPVRANEVIDLDPAAVRDHDEPSR